ncbi:ShlB/FhaC/HecB family hemolysin secretion/activation protein [Erwinia sp. OLTSP20]|uniref:ShlB/FhaC/HecB family hemolysin secretion/activation protein n=1 Tax=unclassified Erwinia TaxID=2622719 RepID=UPI000C17EB7D|nr:MULTISPECIES: ShlB/FhaC/HecB family hemolysin secretion/activation protein [unclassified Erwinia]PIJ50821.1 ShlB/FhaC/HecB family hemolysin secretion/activation protein [Erwinia sp. OAMSP11]PIJ75438.1 ShlB/FhaC/HecB family hemolysin secretion/activation protein [Erwinia sp. OLSSP12]PIJ81988.1 ShlB/FhaC/HecB family hemolysin secretion/activation protein [Erwinia sp. OLCASP19]PIJ84643.1 ShlB/FhaC/HecB family hemolysin secretion/activation protein [Erwinia sp. OLMTSP26]PIJ86992.1 ShlB/FhaC/Hec
MLLISPFALALAAPPVAPPSVTAIHPSSAAERMNNQFIHQQEQQKALEQRLTPKTPDVRLSPRTSSFGHLTFPVEKPCFHLNNVVLEGASAMPHWLPLQRLANQAVGQCLGVKGINLLMRQLQNRLIDHGYVTTRVLAPAQNLKSGSLHLRILPGTIRHVGTTADSGSWVTLYSAFPAHEGNLLDLRDIEQGLENLQRLPTVQAEMEIVPGSKPGESDIDLRWKQEKIWRLAASVDDSGTKETGHYQGALTLFLDNPFSLSDLFYISGSHDLNRGGGKGTHNLLGHYSLPFGYWMFGITANDYHYHQTVAGLNNDYQYSGTSRNLDAQISRVLHRNGSQKTSASVDLVARESRNYIADTEIESQHRRTTSWRVGLQHRHYIGSATLDAGISYQRGTRWFGAMDAPEESFGEATALSRIIQYNLQLDLPFNLVNEQFRYNVQYLRQTSHTMLTPQDQFAIGNRWTVRGFDGERSLSASQGWFVRNDFAWRTPLQQQELYLGVDYGEVGGNDANLIGHHLAGSVLGLRGAISRVGYDLFAGMPVSKPAGYRTSPVTLGFTLTWSY